jgi:hypothetical protein
LLLLHHLILFAVITISGIGVVSYHVRTVLIIISSITILTMIIVIITTTMVCLYYHQLLHYHGFQVIYQYFRKQVRLAKPPSQTPRRPTSWWEQTREEDCLARLSQLGPMSGVVIDTGRHMRYGKRPVVNRAYRTSETNPPIFIVPGSAVPGNINNYYDRSFGSNPQFEHHPSISREFETFSLNDEGNTGFPSQNSEFVSNKRTTNRSSSSKTNESYTEDTSDNESESENEGSSSQNALASSADEQSSRHGSDRKTSNSSDSSTRARRSKSRTPLSTQVDFHGQGQRATRSNSQSYAQRAATFDPARHGVPPNFQRPVSSIQDPAYYAAVPQFHSVRVPLQQRVLMPIPAAMYHSGGGVVFVSQEPEPDPHTRYNIPPLTVKQLDEDQV